MPTSPLVQMWIKTHRCLVCIKYPVLIYASSPRTYKSRNKKEIKHTDKDSTVHLLYRLSSNIYDKWDDFNFEIVNFPFFNGDVPRPLPMAYIFLSLFVLQECVLMLMTSITETYF